MPYRDSDRLLDDLRARRDHAANPCTGPVEEWCFHCRHLKAIRDDLKRKPEPERTMESWRRVWRDGFVPCIGTAGLESLHSALVSDDSRITQGSTTTPPPLMCVQDWLVEAACALGYCGWQGEGLKTVGEVEKYFHKLCFDADTRLAEPAMCRWFLNWFDDTPRDWMRRELLAECELALSQRAVAA